MPSTRIDRIDGVSTSLAIKAPVKAATSSPVTLYGAQTIDGVSCVADDRVLLMGQADGAENGIYNVSDTTWSRAGDFDGARDVVKGTQIPVVDGTVNGGETYRVTSANTITIGTTSLTFELVSFATEVADGIYAELAENNTLSGANSILLANGTEAAPSLAFNSDSDTGFYRVGTNSIALSTAGSLCQFWTGAGITVRGHTSSISVGPTNAYFDQLYSTGNGAGYAIGRFSADATGPRIMALKSRGATIGSLGIVQADDVVLDISGCCDDGTDYATRTASIRIEVDGTPGANDMPGRILFMTTADGAAAVTERLRIDSAGRSTFSGEVTISAMEKRVSTQFDKTSSTVLGDVTGLSVSVVAAGVYSFEARLFTTSNSASGVKAAIGGTATATAIVYQGMTFSGTSISANARGTAMAAEVGAVTAVTAAYITIAGTITVNAAGTLTVQFAQNVSGGTASSVLVGSTFIVKRLA